MEISKEEVRKIIDFLRENPDLAREFGVALYPVLNDRLDSFEHLMDKHFAETNERFLVLNEKFDRLVKEMHDGFETINKRLDAQEFRLNEHDRKFDALIKEMHDGFAIASKERGSIGNTLGKLIENRIADRVEDFAERKGWKISSRVVSKGEEVDLLVRDGLKFFVETKSHADRVALEQTLRKVRKLGIPGVLVGERIDTGVMKEARMKKLLCLSLGDFRSALESGRLERFLSKR